MISLRTLIVASGLLLTSLARSENNAIERETLLEEAKALFIAEDWEAIEIALIPTQLHGNSMRHFLSGRN
ncbi:MAG: hypothetical protein AAF236_11345 [Verrucomicrobiota bacterium]